MTLTRYNCEYFLIFSVVPQSYSVNVMDEHVLKGNTGILKCHIPSFVGDYVFVSAWIEDELTEIYTESDQFAHGNIGILTVVLLNLTSLPFSTAKF